MIRELSVPSPDDMCFFCGKQNESGFKLTFYFDDETNETFADYTPEQRFQGQGQILHGGLQMGLLDEAMWWAGYAETNVMEAVTTGAKFRLLRPVLIGQPIRITCSVTSRDGDNLNIKGRILNADGTICTAVTGVFRIVEREQFAKMIATHR